MADGGKRIAIAKADVNVLNLTVWLGKLGN